MKLYIDQNHKCYLFDPEGVYTPVETELFDGKCGAYIEGYRYIPAGDSWTRADGQVFTGEMAAPWKDYPELDAAQREYERQLLEQAQAENAALLDDMASLVEEVYQGDLELMTE